MIPHRHAVAWLWMTLGIKPGTTDTDALLPGPIQLPPLRDDTDGPPATLRIEKALIQGRGIRPLYSAAPAFHPFSYPYLYPHLPADLGFPIVQQAAGYDHLPTTLLWD